MPGSTLFWQMRYPLAHVPVFDTLPIRLSGMGFPALQRGASCFVGARLPSFRLTRSYASPQANTASPAASIFSAVSMVYKLAEVRVRQRLAATGQTVPDQVCKPPVRPTMHWLFQYFEGIDLHHTLWPDGAWEAEILRLTDLHRQILRLLGPPTNGAMGLGSSRRHTGQCKSHERDGTRQLMLVASGLRPPNPPARARLLCPLVLTRAGGFGGIPLPKRDLQSPAGFYQT